MNQHFNFAHTIAPPAEEDMNDLFTIGGKQIQVESRKKRSPSHEDSDDSDATVKGKHIKKEKKDKHKKEKKSKKDKKDKKDKKSKKHKKRRSLTPQQKSGRVQVYKSNAMQKLQTIMGRYSSTIQQPGFDFSIDASKPVQLGIKIGHSLLSIDVYKVPSRQLWDYGLMQKQVPMYRRHHEQTIVGVAKSKHKTEMIRNMNLQIGQKNQFDTKNQPPDQRYFDYKGYEDCGTELRREDETEEQQRAERIQMNRKVAQDPYNIQAWLEMVRKQQVVGNSSVGHSRAVLQRKISILQKALQSNPLHPILGLEYLPLLAQLKQDLPMIKQKCEQFLKQTPSSLSLWELYFWLSTHHLPSFSHALLPTLLQRAGTILKQAVKTPSDAINLRKVWLLIVSKTAEIYKLEGYHQLATSMLIALIEFNYCVPGEYKDLQFSSKLKVFQQYWDELKHYRIGEVEGEAGWGSNPAQGANFITTTDAHYPHLHPLKAESADMKYHWKAANPLKEASYIEEHPQSLILYEDISFALISLPPEHLPTLIDSLANQLQLPLVFSPTTITHSYTATLAQIHLTQHRTYSLKNRFYFWQKWLNPAQTLAVVPEHNLTKIQYLRRIIMRVKPQLSAQDQQTASQYACLLLACVYLNPSLQKTLRMSQQRCMELIGQLLQNEPLNIGLWAIYIQTTYEATRDKQQCLQCFTQLIDTVEVMVEELQKKGTKMEVLFWMYVFGMTNHLQITHNLLTQYYKLLTGEEVFALGPMQALKMQKVLSEKVNEQEVSLERSWSMVAVMYAKFYSSSSLSELVPEIVEQTVQIVLRRRQKHHLLLWWLTSHSLLTQQHILNHSLPKQQPYLFLIQYWAQHATGHLLALQYSFSSLPYRSLSLWMTLILSRPTLHPSPDEYWLRVVHYAKKLALEQSTTQNYPNYIVLLNSLVTQQSRLQAENILMVSLQQLPFSKELYLLALQYLPMQRGQLRLLIQQKGIRLTREQELLRGQI